MPKGINRITGRGNMYGYMRSENNATIPPTDEDIAWAAGIYEGEGSVFFVRSRDNLLKVKVTQKDPEILHKLKDYFGGSVNGYTRKDKGETYHHYELFGTRARIFLWLISPYLSSTRRKRLHELAPEVL